MHLLSRKELTELEELASLFLPVSEISAILQISLSLLETELQNKESLIYKHFTKGRLLSKTEVHKSIFDMAKRDSPVSQKLARTIIENEEMNNL